MRVNKARKPRPPLTDSSLNELALAYVGKFATTRAKLRSYLARKIRERGWNGNRTPDLDAVADRFSASGYVDDAAYALSKSRALTGRGYGFRRVDQSLRAAGVAEADAMAAREHAQSGSVDAALRFAERRRIGPFANEPAEAKARERAIAAMIRAGHGFGLAKAIIDMPPGAGVDREQLSDFQSE